jgi:hypothetical protein
LGVKLASKLRNLCFVSQRTVIFMLLFSHMSLAPVHLDNATVNKEILYGVVMVFAGSSDASKQATPNVSVIK